MNLFNSIFSDDPEPSNSPRSSADKIAAYELDNPNSENPNPVPESSSPGAPASAWNFGSMIKTITTRSETVIGHYRRDLEEFGSGLIKETALIRDVASRAVKELPDSIDAGAAVAQESLESVGQVIDNLGSSVWRGTRVVLARGKELILLDDDDDDDGSNGRQSSERSLNVKKYSWFDARMRDIQGDRRTYTEEPDDSEDYKKWKSSFVLDERGEEIENLMAEERLVERSYLELVPVAVDKESFWSRYFYKVNKVKQAEESRARIVKRAIAGDDDEDLSWDVDEDDDNDVQASECEIAEDSSVGTLKEAVESSGNGSCGEIKVVAGVSDASESNVNHFEKPSFPEEEEELGWDEIDDVGSVDDSKAKAGSNLNLSDLRMRLNVADEDEELRWDIEDDDA